MITLLSLLLLAVSARGQVVVVQSDDQQTARQNAAGE